MDLANLIRPGLTVGRISVKFIYSDAKFPPDADKRRYYPIRLVITGAKQPQMVHSSGEIQVKIRSNCPLDWAGCQICNVRGSM